MIALGEIGDLTLKAGPILAQNKSVRLALLFGSRARGNARPDSDFDVAVDAPAEDVPTLASALSLEWGHETDVVSLNQVTIPLLEALVRDSMVLYERQKGAGAAWRARALIDLETDRPWYRRMRDAWIRSVAEGGLFHGR